MSPDRPRMCPSLLLPASLLATSGNTDEKIPVAGPLSISRGGFFFLENAGWNYFVYLLKH